MSSPDLPFQWEGVLRNGLIHFKKNSGQNYARSAPGRFEVMRVLGAGFPFEIPFPPGADPVVIERRLMTVGVGGDSLKHHPSTFLYGWEKDGKFSLYEFSKKGEYPIHHDHP